MFRPACGECPFTNYRRTGDITLGDFWEKGSSNRIYTAFNADNKGISLALLNTPKGKKLFDAIKHRLDYLESDTAECWQPQLEHPPKMNPKFSGFEKDYLSHDFRFIIRKYGNTGVHAATKAIMEKTLKIAKILLGDNGYKIVKALLTR
jgi:hypothetical protein